MQKTSQASFLGKQTHDQYTTIYVFPRSWCIISKKSEQRSLLNNYRVQMLITLRFLRSGTGNLFWWLNRTTYRDVVNGRSKTEVFATCKCSMWPNRRMYITKMWSNKNKSTVSWGCILLKIINKRVYNTLQKKKSSNKGSSYDSGLLTMILLYCCLSSCERSH